MNAYRLTYIRDGRRIGDMTYATDADLAGRLKAAADRGERVEVHPIGEVADPGSVGHFGFDYSPVWPGIDTGRNWNGWAVPMFTREVAEDIVAWMSEAAEEGEPRSRIDADGTLHLFCYGQGYTADDAEAWEVEQPDEHGRYFVGSGYTWSREDHPEIAMAIVAAAKVADPAAEAVRAACRAIGAEPDLASWSTRSEWGRIDLLWAVFRAAESHINAEG